MTTVIRRSAMALLLLAMIVVPTGCLTKRFPHKERFVLEVERPGPAQATVAGPVRVGRVQVSPLFERKGFVYRTDDVSYQEDFYNEFFVPPATLIQRATLDWMRRASVFSIILAPGDHGDVDWLLEGIVHDLYGDARVPGSAEAVMRIEYTLLEIQKTGAVVAFRQEYSAREPLVSDDHQAFLAALERALAGILADLEGDLREKLGSSVPTVN